MNDLITFLYISNAIIAASAYVPQCFKLWQMLKTDSVNKSVSLLTWAMWSWTWIVTLIYALVVSHDDWALMVTSLVNALLCIVTLTLSSLVHIRSNQNIRKQNHDAS